MCIWTILSKSASTSEAVYQTACGYVGIFDSDKPCQFCGEQVEIDDCKGNCLHYKDQCGGIDE